MYYLLVSPLKVVELKCFVMKPSSTSSGTSANSSNIIIEAPLIVGELSLTYHSSGWSSSSWESGFSLKLEDRISYHHSGVVFYPIRGGCCCCHHFFIIKLAFLSHSTHWSRSNFSTSILSINHCYYYILMWFLLLFVVFELILIEWGNFSPNSNTTILLFVLIMIWF